jgi:molybdenum-dependent DNA-binding transcriptional regulator ModE
MADIKSPDKVPQIPEQYSKLTSNIFAIEKTLIKLLAGVPVEKQEEFTGEIQYLSKKRLNLVFSESKEESKEVLDSIGSLQEQYNELLDDMISEIIEEKSVPQYKESEPAMKLMRTKSLTKGMIVGNFNEVLDSMDRVLSIGENLIIQGYQKLFIDTASIKEKLQVVIDDRRNLPVCNKPLDTLIVKQKYCERQLNCLLMLFQEANTLSDLITRMEEFDKRQIQLQKTSQISIDHLKKFFYKPDSRKTNERRRTYLSVSYANPDNTREGLDILKDQVNSIVRNINVVCDMEDGKVRAINKSDLGDLCENTYEENKQLLDEEKEIFDDIFDILLKHIDNPEDIEDYNALIEDLPSYTEKPDTQLETIKYFTNRGLYDQKKRLELTKSIYRAAEKLEKSYSNVLATSQKLQAKIPILIKENSTLKSQINTQVVGKISEGTQSLKELFDYQEQLKKTITDSIESQIKQQINELVLLNSGIVEVLLGVNPDDDIKTKVLEYEVEYNKSNSLPELLSLLSRYQTWIFRLVCKLGLVSEGYIHANISNLKKSSSLKEARESLVGKPSEYPLASMDRTLSEILRSYLSSLEDTKGNIESVIKKQNVLARLFRDFKG